MSWTMADASTEKLVPQNIEEDGLIKLAIKASAHWAWTFLVFAGVGTLVSWLSFIPLATPLWESAPVLHSARAGGAGALLALLVLLLMPVGYVSLLFIAVFPAGFFFLGHTLGVQAVVSRIVEGRGATVSKWIVKHSWKGVELLSKTPGTISVNGILTALVSHSNQKGASRRVFRWILNVAKVPEFLATSAFLQDVKKKPAESRAKLTQLTETILNDFTETHRLRILLVTTGLVVALSLSGPIWLPWLGVPV